ncbi:MAG TPA: class I SAM-dependent methyltransferase [Vicinamibacteria bacterium]|jgi:SAM-dependent methyltransferase
MGIVGGRVGYHLLRGIGRRGEAAGPLPGHLPWRGKAYQGRSKLEVLFGPGIWAEVAGKVVIDFGCADGVEAVEVATHGAKRVIGVDTRPSVLEMARQAAEASGVADRCVFSTQVDEKADLIFSIDWFEHYDDVAGILRQMRRLIKDDGRVRISFGPPWYHPLGGHLFSVFPWSHLVFTERALIRWRSDFKTDGATRFREVEGGLNQMTIRRFERLLAASDFRVERFETPPIKRFRALHNRLTREFFTSFVRCTLVPRTGRS